MEAQLKSQYYYLYHLKLQIMAIININMKSKTIMTQIECLTFLCGTFLQFHSQSTIFYVNGYNYKHFMVTHAFRVTTRYRINLTDRVIIARNLILFRGVCGAFWSITVHKLLQLYIFHFPLSNFYI